MSQGEQDQTNAWTDTTAHVGAIVCGYKLLQQIGEGGMGSVWMAEQSKPVRRSVALKLVKQGMDTREVLARFEAERQAIALMDHPNIARALDAGATPDGRPYFAMELVKGVPITKYCDDHRLTLRERLELFVPVCHAIQHAHQKGIIHRDIKPSNILVAQYDAKATPKVIDFGVAKAVGQRLTEKTLFTGFGSIIGTLEYMSPEQAEFNALDVDTRSDVYSLGVVLYELLTGSTPLRREEVKKSAVMDVLKRIRETDPPSPSRRLSESRDALPSLSAQRKLEPMRLSRFLKGELDWIVMKALEKERGRRYESANGFARDIERYLANEPIEAGPPSATYRLSKMLSKYRSAALAAAALAAAMLVGLIGTTWGMWRATQAERVARAAEQNEAKLRAQADRDRDAATEAKAAATEAFAKLEIEKDVSDSLRKFFVDELLVGANANRRNSALSFGGIPTSQAIGRANPTVRELLIRASDSLLGTDGIERFAHRREIESEILQVLGESLIASGGDARAVDVFQRNRELCERIHGPVAAATIRARQYLGVALSHLGKGDAAKRELDFVIGELRKTHKPNDPEYLLAIAELVQSMHYLDRTGQGMAEIDHIVEATLAGSDSMVEDPKLLLPYLSARAKLLFFSARAAKDKGTLLEQCREVVSRIDELAGKHSPASVYARQSVLQALVESGELNAAIEKGEELLAISKEVFGPNAVETQNCGVMTANARYGVGDLAGAEAGYAAVVAGQANDPSLDRRETLSNQLVLAIIQSESGKYADATSSLTNLSFEFQQRFGTNSPDTINANMCLAKCLLDQGQYKDALPRLLELRNVATGVYDAESATISWFDEITAVAFIGSGQVEAGVEAANRRIEWLKKRGNVDPTTISRCQTDFGSHLVNAKAHVLAERFLLESLELARTSDATPPEDIIATLSWLATARQNAGQPADMWLPLWKERLDWLAKMKTPNHDLAAQCAQDWLVAVVKAKAWDQFDQAVAKASKLVVDREFNDSTRPKGDRSIKRVLETALLIPAVPGAIESTIVQQYLRNIIQIASREVRASRIDLYVNTIALAVVSNEWKSAEEILSNAEKEFGEDINNLVYRDMQDAIFCRYRGNSERGARIARNAIRRAAKSPTPLEADRALKCAFLWPDTYDDVEDLESLVERLRVADNHQYRHYFAVTLALYYLRRGDWKKVDSTVSIAANLASPPVPVSTVSVAYLVRARAKLETGDLEKAKELWAEISRHLPESISAIDNPIEWHDWMVALILAEEFKQRLAEVATGDKTGGTKASDDGPSRNRQE